MAACDPWNYRGVDARVFMRLQQYGLQQGVTIKNHPVGEFRLKVGGFAIVFRYGWDAATKTFRLMCMEKPMLLGCGAVKTYADKIIRECGGTPS